MFVVPVGGENPSGVLKKDRDSFFKLGSFLKTKAILDTSFFRRSIQDREMCGIQEKWM